MAKQQSVLQSWSKKYGFFLLAFVPMLQWIPCFVMNGRVRRKKWLIMGVAYIAIGLASLVGLIAISEWSSNNYVRYPDGPDESEYMGFTYDDYRGDDGLVDWDAYHAAENEWRKTDSYKDYQKAYKEYQNSPEYKAVEEKNSRRYRIEDNVTSVCMMAVVLKYFVYMVWVYFIERYRYREAISEEDSRKRVYQRVAEKSTSTRKKAPAPDAPVPVRTRPESDVIPDEISGKLNINQATEAQIEALPLISVVDSKRIIEYRNTHGGFNSTDEFFQSFNAKPHVIVKLQDVVTIDEVVRVVKETPAATTKQRFDL